MSTKIKGAQEKLQNQTLILAVSGGPDSVFLVEKLSKIQKSNNLKLVIAHVNHSLREKDSDQDQQFVETLAKKKNIPFESTKIDIQALAKKEKLNLEETGRIQRYLYLEKIREKYKGDYILTAHHQNDRVESSLFSLIRGCSLKGIIGIKEKTELLIQGKKIEILRPLLNITKAEILKDLKRKNIKYRIDQTNFDSKYNRNLIRNEIIPLIRKINPSFEKTYINNLKNFNEATQFINKKTEKWIKENFKNNSFLISTFNKEDTYIKGEILFKIIEKTDSCELSSKQIEEIINLIKKGKTNTKKIINKNLELTINYKNTIFQTVKPKNNIVIKENPLNLGKNKYEFGEIICEIIKNKSSINFKEKKRNEIFIKWEDGIFFRSFKNGDKISPLGLKGSKKLQDIFTDLKIKQEERKKIPILFSKQSNEIISISHYVISEKFKITNLTKNILKITFTKK